MNKETGRETEIKDTFSQMFYKLFSTSSKLYHNLIQHSRDLFPDQVSVSESRSRSDAVVQRGSDSDLPHRPSVPSGARPSRSAG